MKRALFVGLLVVLSFVIGLRVGEATVAGGGGPVRYKLAETVREAVPFKLQIRQWTSGDECGRLVLVAYEPERSRSVYRCKAQ